MVKTTTNCPRCRQPIVANVEQLFDMNQDSGAKQKLLSGSFNLVQCNVCGYQGNLSTPIVYHDPEKELLLTYFPPEMALPVNEQEKMIGPHITRVMERLPQEKRKAYLLRPETMLTMETMIERILEADGITKDMLNAQKERLNLLQRLLKASQEERAEIVRQEEAIIDQEFFGIFNRIIEATLAQGDQEAAKQLAAIQKELLAQTEVGKSILKQSQEMQETIKALQEASKNGLTREKLLDLIMDNADEARLGIIVSLARPAMDYSFFQILSDRINAAKDGEKEELIELREQLLDLTAEYDDALNQRALRAQKILDEIIDAEDVEKAMASRIDAIDDLMVQLIRSEHEKANQQGDPDRLRKLEEIIQVLQKISAPPPEIALIEKFLEADDEESLKKMLEENAEKITPDFAQLVGSMAAQSEAQGQNAEILEKLKMISKMALRFSMRANLKKVASG